MCDCPFTNGVLCLYTRELCQYDFAPISGIYGIPDVGRIDYARYCGAVVTSNTPLIQLASPSSAEAPTLAWAILLLACVSTLSRWYR